MPPSSAVRHRPLQPVNRRRFARRPIALTFGLCSILAAGTATAQAALPVPQLDSGQTTATAGYFALSWQLPDAATPLAVELQQAQRPDFAQAQTLYQGSDTASLRSGLADGTYHYRVRALAADGTPGAWSTPVSVEVAHHPLSRALAFFALGAVVFIGTLGLILWGAYQTRQQETR